MASENNFQCPDTGYQYYYNHYCETYDSYTGETRYYDGDTGEELIGETGKPLIPIKRKCEHNSIRPGHSPFVACICNDCGEEI